MKSITINGSKRESVGKVATKALRNAGQVPCVLYGGETPVHFNADERAFAKLVYTPNAHTVVIDLGDDGSFNAILQDIQFHPVSDKILHIDFYQLFDDKEVTMNIPVLFKGTAPGVRESGGVLRKTRRKLRVRALPANLPDSLEADLSNLKLGDKLYVTELQSDLFKILHPDNAVVCQVRTARTSILSTAEEEEEMEEGAETEEGAAPAGEGTAEESAQE